MSALTSSGRNSDTHVMASLCDMSQSPDAPPPPPGTECQAEAVQVRTRVACILPAFTSSWLDLEEPGPPQSPPPELS